MSPVAMEDAEKIKSAEFQTGVGIRKLFTCGSLSFLWFYITWVIVWMIVGMNAGLVIDDTRNDPLWFQLFILILPIILMVVLRRQVRKFVPKVFGSVLMLLSAAFFLMISVLAIG